MAKLKKVCEDLIKYGIIEIIIIQGSEIIDTFKINNIEDHNLDKYTLVNYDYIWYEIDNTKCGTVKAYLKD